MTSIDARAVGLGGSGGKDDDRNGLHGAPAHTQQTHTRTYEKRRSTLPHCHAFQRGQIRPAGLQWTFSSANQAFSRCGKFAKTEKSKVFIGCPYPPSAARARTSKKSKAASLARQGPSPVGPNLDPREKPGFVLRSPWRRPLARGFRMGLHCAATHTHGTPPARSRGQRRVTLPVCQFTLPNWQSRLAYATSHFALA